jgi:hypothetical protein
MLPSVTFTFSKRVAVVRIGGRSQWPTTRRPGLAAFRFIEEQRRLTADEGVLPHKVLVEGFVYEGQRVPTHGRQVIFKSRVLREIPLSVTTVAVVDGETRPYDDAFDEDGLLQYRYRGTDPQHHENVGLRLAMQGAGMSVGLHKYAGGVARQRGSKPKLQVPTLR